MANESSWKDVSVIVLGRTIRGIEDVKYKPTVEKEYLYGRGNKPIGIQTGNFKAEGKLTIHQSEYDELIQAIQSASPGSGLGDIAVDIVVSYDNDNGAATTDIIKGAEFSDLGERGMAQNDKYMKMELSFMALDILYAQ